MSYANYSPRFSIEAFCEGDQQAFNFIFASYYPSVCFFANRLIATRPVAEDITQEAFVRLWQRHDAFSCQQSIKAFLYVITRNACLNFIRQDQRNKISEQGIVRALDETEDSVLAKLSQLEIKAALTRAIESLPQECRKVIQLSYIEGIQNKDIAMSLGLSVHTIKNQKARGLYLLKKRLQRSSVFN
ncbi:MAG: RNA polymerase sigma-70 factor [Chitinophagaceae bacterium]